MLMTIRQNVFETNSSSMHSISYTPRASKQLLDFDFGKTIKGHFGEYGWGYEVLASFNEKLSYVLTSLRYIDNEIDEDNIETINNSRFFKWLKELVKDQTGAELIVGRNNNEDYDDEDYDDDDNDDMGYVDHQSTDTLPEFGINSSSDETEFKVLVSKLLFDPGYMIIIDNDNR